MSKRSEQRSQVAKTLVTHILENGLAKTSLRQLASAAGVSDRMLLYYFDNKSEIMIETLRLLAMELTEILASAIPTQEKMTAAELFQIGAPLMTSKNVQPYMHVSMEIASLARRGEEPYASVFREIIAGFRFWIESRLSTEDNLERQTEAMAILTMIDGLSIASAGLDEADLTAVIDYFIRCFPNAPNQN